MIIIVWSKMDCYVKVFEYFGFEYEGEGWSWINFK